MRAFTPRHEPPALQQYRSTAGTYAELPKDLKNSIRDSLRDEQQGFCAYCCRRLGDDVRIEHFHPQKATAENEPCMAATGISKPADTGLRWTNLLLCCPGDEGGKETHCDVAKRDTDICQCFPNPKNAGPPKLLVRAMPDGRVIAATTLGPGAKPVIDEVLRLNCSQLINERKAQLRARWLLFTEKAWVLKSRKRAREAVLHRLDRRPSGDINDMLFKDWLENGRP